MSIPTDVEETTETSDVSEEAEISDLPEVELSGVPSAFEAGRTQPSFDSLVADQNRIEFDSQTYLRPRIQLPVRGWRGGLQRATFGVVKPGPSARQQYEDSMQERIRARVITARKIAFASAKGGVGKTTTTLMCGHALATHRLDRIIAVDANPDAGSLGYRVERETEATLSDLLRRADNVESYADIRELTSLAPSRLEVLASENDPAISQALVEADYRRAVAALERFYSVVLCDLGTGLLDSATQGIMKFSNQIVVVTAPSVDAGRVASFTLDFVERRSPLKAQNAVVLINNVRRDSLVDVKSLAKYFRGRARAVVTIPYDRHLASGGQPEWARLRRPTQDAYLAAAAAIADGFVLEPGDK
jgi:putative peptide zinc metalloprotease protein